MEPSDMIDEQLHEQLKTLWTECLKKSTPEFRWTIQLPPGAAEWSWSADGGWEQNFDFSVKTEE